MIGHLRTASFVLYVILLLLLCGPAHACECRFETLREVYNEEQIEYVLRVHVNSIKETPDTTIYYVNILETFKGCSIQDKNVKIRSDTTSCEDFLEEGTEYLVTATARDCTRTGSPKKALYIDACGQNKRWNSLNDDDLNFLMTREICCDGSCECVSDDAFGPCDTFFVCTTRDPCDEGICKTNVCARCASEYLTIDNRPVCYSCETDFDCGYQQVCVNNPNCGDPARCPKPKICRNRCSPETDFDTCPPGSECRLDGLCYNKLGDQPQ